MHDTPAPIVLGGLCAQLLRSRCPSHSSLTATSTSAPPTFTTARGSRATGACDHNARRTQASPAHFYFSPRPPISLIRHSYLRGWFWIDAPSSIPLELLDLIPGSSTSNFTILRLLRLFRLLRLLKLLKVDDLIERLEDAYDTNLRLFQVCTLLPR